MSSLRRLAFDVGEYRRRVCAVQQIMAERDLDALLCHDFPNICYLTGMESVLWTKHFLAVVPREGDPILVSQDFELPNARYCVWLDDLVGYDLHRDPVEVTRELLIARGYAGKRLGIENATLHVPFWERLRDALADSALIEANDIVARVK